MRWKWILPLLTILLAWAPAQAQEEVTSGTYRYKDHEVSTGYYEEYEVRPGRSSPFIQWSKVDASGRGLIPGTPLNQVMRNPRFASDAHAGLPDYRFKSCQSCHAASTHNNLHVTRRGISCRQCHGGEPMASINHYFSQLNPIRRHAYVCAKCHQGANASFGMYLVHSPNPAAADTFQSFPTLAYAFWIMIAIAGLTFVLFLPHTTLWLLRDLLRSKKKEIAE